MEILLLPIGLIVGGYIITRLSRIDIRAIVGELKAVVGALILMVSLLGLAVALSTGTMTPDELNDRTAALIQSATVLIADHMTSIAIGAVATPIALLLVAVLIRPIMGGIWGSDGQRAIAYS